MGAGDRVRKAEQRWPRTRAAVLETLGKELIFRS
jgi:hypothetical protein